MCLMASKLCWPIAVKSLAVSRDTRHGHRGGGRKTWMLDIAGPFCIVCHPSCMGSRVAGLCDRLSNLCALPVRYKTRHGAIAIKVEVTAQEWERILGDEYHVAKSALHQGYQRKTKETRYGK